METTEIKAAVNEEDKEKTENSLVDQPGWIKDYIARYGKEPNLFDGV